MSDYKEDYYVDLIAKMSAENEKLEVKIKTLEAQIIALHAALRIVAENIGRYR